MKKLDKDFLNKNGFWVALGFASALLLIGIVLLMLGPASQSGTAKENYKKAMEELNKSDLKNDTFLGPWQDRQKEFAGHKGVVWGDAWKTQQGLATWPGELKKFEDMHFGEEVKDRDLILFRDSEYEKQFTRRAFLTTGTGEELYLPFEFDEKKIFNQYQFPQRTTPTSEECWLAQEEIWLRRELLAVLRHSLDLAGRFTEVRERTWHNPIVALGGGGIEFLVNDEPKYQPRLFKRTQPPEPGITLVKVFRNPRWEITLLIEPDPKSPNRLQISPKSTIRNINAARRPLSLVNGGHGTILRARQGREERVLGQVFGELLPHDAKTEFKTAVPSRGIDFREEFVLEEVFEPATSPIKRLENLTVGHMARSHRNAVQNDLQTNPRTSPPKDETQTPTDPMMPGGEGKFGPGGLTQPGVEGGGMNPGFSSADLTLHQIHRKRYALCNDQVRRVPVAFSVVIDQAYRNDILTAVANSRLRIQTAQVHWRHRDAVAQAPGTGPNYYQPPPDMFGMGGGLPPPEGQPETRTGGIPGIGLAPGGMPTGMPGDETPMPTADVQVEGNRNLIELSVYGIATLYERHPPKEKTDGTPPMTP